MLCLFIALIVFALLAALMAALVKLIRDVGELAALVKSLGSGAENTDAQNAITDASGNDAPYKHPYTQDDIIYKDGSYYENENSEDWEEFEYEISEDERFK